MAKIKRATVPSIGKDVEELKCSYTDDENVENYRPFGKQFDN